MNNHIYDFSDSTITFDEDIYDRLNKALPLWEEAFRKVAQELIDDIDDILDLGINIHPNNREELEIDKQELQEDIKKTQSKDWFQSLQEKYV